MSARTRGQAASRRRVACRGVVALLAALVLTTGCEDRADDALLRGDRMLATGRTGEALAEYELALRRRGRDPSVLLRLADTRARQGELQEALDRYEQLLGADSTYRPQAAAALVALADTARRRGDGDRMLRALEPVLRMGLPWVAPELRLAAAEELWARKEVSRALPLYLSVVTAPDSTVAEPVLLHLARSYEELGACQESLPFFAAYLERNRRARGSAERTSAQWHYGSCLFSVARSQQEAGEPASAEETLTELLELGAPTPLMDDAHFARAEALLALDRRDEARTDFREVLRLNPARSGPLVQQAEQRLRELRYSGS